MADFCAPYAVSGQSLVVDASRHPQVQGIDNLRGLVVGVQHGNTSEPVAEKLVAEHRAARVRVYAYNQIEQALDDLSTGGCDAFMKLAPVTAWLVRDRPKLKVVQVGITTERLGICVRKENTALREAISKAQSKLVADGTLTALVKEWLGATAHLPSSHVGAGYLSPGPK
jgi:ABC-type amino acid transport substrate-binding protein